MRPSREPDSFNPLAEPFVMYPRITETVTQDHCPRVSLRHVVSRKYNDREEHNIDPVSHL